MHHGIAGQCEDGSSSTWQSSSRCTEFAALLYAGSARGLGTDVVLSLLRTVCEIPTTNQDYLKRNFTNITANGKLRAWGEAVARQPGFAKSHTIFPILLQEKGTQHLSVEVQNQNRPPV